MLDNMTCCLFVLHNLKLFNIGVKYSLNITLKLNEFNFEPRRKSKNIKQAVEIKHKNIRTCFVVNILS